MAELRSKSGFLTRGDGIVDNARFYFGADEDAPPDRARLDPKEYATWVEHDGAVGIRRGTTISVGATPTYAAHYDDLDWGN